MRDGDDGGGGRRRESDLERLMRSLSEDVSTNAQSQNQRPGTLPLPAPRDFSSSFSQAQPSFLTELLSMPSPSVGWSSALSDGPILPLVDFHSVDQGYSAPQRPQEATFWDTLPEYPASWFAQEGPCIDGLQELLTTPAPWTTAPVERGSHSSSVMGSPTSPSPARLNSAALPDTPNSSMSSESFSDAAAEEDHSHHGVSSRPLLQPAAGSSSAKRKSPDRALDDEIQSLDSKKP
jgi:hypothetical protein